MLQFNHRFQALVAYIVGPNMAVFADMLLVVKEKDGVWNILVGQFDQLFYFTFLQCRVRVVK